MFARAVELGLMTKDIENEITLKLLCARYVYTGVTAEVVSCAAEKSAWSPDEEPLSKILDEFSNSNTEADGLLRLAAHLIKEAWQKCSLEQTAQLITFRILKKLALRTDGQHLINAIRDNLDRIFGLDVLKTPKVAQCITLWRKTGGSLIL